MDTMGTTQTWEPDLVQATLIGAARFIGATTPRVGPASIRSSMPEIARDWEDWAGWVDDNGHVPTRPMGIIRTQAKVTMAEQAMLWPLRYVTREDYRRILCAFIGARAVGRPFSKVIRAKGWTERTANDRKSRALSAISVGLDADSVPVSRVLDE